MSHVRQQFSEQKKNTRQPQRAVIGGGQKYASWHSEQMNCGTRDREKHSFPIFSRGRRCGRVHWIKGRTPIAGRRRRRGSARAPRSSSRSSSSDRAHTIKGSPQQRLRRSRLGRLRHSRSTNARSVCNRPPFFIIHGPVVRIWPPRRKAHLSARRLRFTSRSPRAFHELRGG